MRYMASYQLVIDEKRPKTGSKWMLQDDMSINTAGEHGRLANLSRIAQPSVGAEWGTGYYFKDNMKSPRGLGPPGMLFVLSVDSLWNAAWFLVNQRTLDLGPEVALPNCRLGGDPSHPIRPTNCWGDAPGAEAGELDLLETPFWDSNLRSDEGYRRMYLTTTGSTGFCNPQRNSAYKQYNNGAGGHGTTSYFEDDAVPGPHVYAAVVDAAGVTVYRDPDWPGLTASRAEPTLPLRPKTQPASNGAPCPASASSCVRFNPLCVTVPSNETTYKIVGGPGNSKVVRCPGVASFGMTPQCIASSWWNLFADTGQWEADISGKEGTGREHIDG